MVLVFEYLFCLMYGLGLYICLFPYLEKKRKLGFIVVFLFSYGIIDFFITQDFFIELHKYLIINFMVIISDFIMMCIYEHRFRLGILFYTTFYFVIYSIVVNIITFGCSAIGINVNEMYTFSVLRIALVVINIVGTVLIFKLFKKLNVLPKREIVDEYYYIFDTINVIVLFSFLLFFGFSLIKIDSIFIVVMFIIFIFLWLILLLLLNKAIFLVIENNNLTILNTATKNAELIIENFKIENEELSKIRHDLKNHLQIIRELDAVDEIRNYVDGIIGDINKVSSPKYKTGSSNIDIILSLKKVQYPDIIFNTKIDVKDILIEFKDLSSILFNLIDNAAQNVSKINNNIYIKIIQQFDSLVIVVINPVDEKPIFISRKGAGHGNGLKIVRGIVGKYRGDFKIEADNERVSIQIIIEKNTFND